MREPIPGLTPAICPECGATDSLVERDKQITQRTVAGVNEEGLIEFLPDTETLSGDGCHLLCLECWSEPGEDEVADATYGDETA